MEKMVEDLHVRDTALILERVWVLDTKEEVGANAKGVKVKLNDETGKEWRTDAINKGKVPILNFILISVCQIDLYRTQKVRTQNESEFVCVCMCKTD